MTHDKLTENDIDDILDTLFADHEDEELEVQAHFFLPVTYVVCGDVEWFNLEESCAYLGVTADAFENSQKLHYNGVTYINPEDSFEQKTPHRAS